jgi:protease secretion system membrane fusion protein
MMDIVPSDDALVVEGQLPVNLIDRVHTGLEVELMFAAFNTNRTPHIPGELIQGFCRSYGGRAHRPTVLQGACTRDQGRSEAHRYQENGYSFWYASGAVCENRRTHHDELSVEAMFDRAKSAMSED